MPIRPTGVDTSAALLGDAGRAAGGARGDVRDAVIGGVGARHLGSVAATCLGAVGLLGAGHGLSLGMVGHGSGERGRVERIVVDTWRAVSRR